jgi:hypothetical protein
MLHPLEVSSPATAPTPRETVRALVDDDQFEFSRWLLLQSSPLGLDVLACVWVGCASLGDLVNAETLKRHLVVRHGGRGIDALDEAELRYWEGEE